MVWIGKGEPSPKFAGSGAVRCGVSSDRQLAGVPRVVSRLQPSHTASSVQSRISLGSSWGRLWTVGLTWSAGNVDNLGRRWTDVESSLFAATTFDGQTSSGCNQYPAYYQPHNHRHDDQDGRVNRRAACKIVTINNISTIFTKFVIRTLQF